MHTAAVRRLAAPLRVPAFRQLWTAQLASETGDWAARVALAVLVYGRTHSTTLTGLATAASLLPWIGIGQVLGAAAGRWPARRVMVVTDVVRALAWTAAATRLPVPVLLAVVFVAGLATPPFAAARAAVRPALLPAELLGPAVAVFSITSDLTFVLGSVAGGGLVGLIGARGALLVNAASFAVSALILCRLPRQPAPGRRGKLDLGPAVSLLVRDPVLRRAQNLANASAIAATGMVAVASPFSVLTLHRSAAFAGMLAAITGVTCALVTGAVGHPTGGPAALMRRAALVCLLGGVGAVALATVAPAVAAGTALFAVCGLLLVVLTPANVTVTELVPPHLRMPVFSVLSGTLVAAQAGGAALTGLLAGAVGPAAACALISIPALALGAWSVAVPVRAAGSAADTATGRLGAEPAGDGQAA